MKSLPSTPETNITLKINYISCEVKQQRLMLRVYLLHNDMGDFFAESGNSFQILQEYFFSFFVLLFTMSHFSI